MLDFNYVVREWVQFESRSNYRRNLVIIQRIYSMSTWQISVTIDMHMRKKKLSGPRNPEIVDHRIHNQLISQKTFKQNVHSTHTFQIQSLQLTQIIFQWWWTCWSITCKEYTPNVLICPLSKKILKQSLQLMTNKVQP